MDTAEDDGSGLGEPGARRGLDWMMSSSESSDSSSSSSSSGGDGDAEWSEIGDDGESFCSANCYNRVPLSQHKTSKPAPTSARKGQLSTGWGKQPYSYLQMV